MHRFLHPDELQPEQEIQLSKDQSAHLCRVLRMTKGDVVEIFNGRGQLASATILRSSPQKSAVRILTLRHAGERPKVHLSFGFPKGAALDFIVRRGTEIGVAGFHPLITQHSIHPKAWNQKRWEKVVREVCKQCEALYLPESTLGIWLRGILSLSLQKKNGRW